MNRINFKPTIRLRRTKSTIEIIKTIYDDYGKAVRKIVEAVKR